MDTNTLTFEADGGEPDCNSWRYKLLIKQNSEFTLNFHLRSWQGDSNWSDASVYDWVYTGNLTVAFENGAYALTFSDIYKSGESQANGDWSGPKPIQSTPYGENMSAIIKPDGTCNFKKANWGVYMKGGSHVDEFFKTYYQVDIPGLVFPKTLRGSFSGDTTTEDNLRHDKDYDRCDSFDLKDDQTFVHYFSYCNHDYCSEREKRSSGNYVISGDVITLGNDTLKMVLENGKLSYAKWGEFKLKWTENN